MKREDKEHIKEGISVVQASLINWRSSLVKSRKNRAFRMMLIEDISVVYMDTTPTPTE